MHPDTSHDDRLLELARRMLDAEVIDWAKEDVAEAEVREGLKRLERIIGRRCREVIGGFRRIRKLGERGMGVVYEAEQQHPRRAVALKVIRGGALVSPNTLKLFRREQAEKARSLGKRWAELTESLYGQESLEYADVVGSRGGVDNAIRAHALRSRILKPEDPRMAGSFYQLGNAQFYRDLPEGEVNLKRALELVEKTSQPDEGLHLSICNDLAIGPSNRGDHLGAVEWLHKAQEVRDRIYPEGHPQRVMGLGDIGDELMLAGKLQEARPYIEAALAAMEKALPAEHLMIAAHLRCLGELERLENRPDRARPLLERALAIYDEQAARSGPSIWNGDWNYVELLRSLGLVDDAEGRLNEALEHFARAQDARSHMAGIAINDPSPDYARVLRKAGRIAEAEKVEASLTLASTK